MSRREVSKKDPSNQQSLLAFVNAPALSPLYPTCDASAMESQGKDLYDPANRPGFSSAENSVDAACGGNLFRPVRDLQEGGTTHVDDRIGEYQRQSE
ncbi:hypothetical protein FYK55_17345 [Roseiconus nitratireducens]|uniref:Uncharacterized protein n=1 Tax=Roseiconus nitratireducens TaxID=2605748 RepID=A0A5M6D419_9BACT|nr:hypothetical protein [Roseiconus nitratireducens]KAA5541340.1 hypothetical protein FYK55_17345 [Roseiconus nitratireducens]